MQQCPTVGKALLDYDVHPVRMGLEQRLCGTLLQDVVRALHRVEQPPRGLVSAVVVVILWHGNEHPERLPDELVLIRAGHRQTDVPPVLDATYTMHRIVDDRIREYAGVEGRGVDLVEIKVGTEIRFRFFHLLQKVLDRRRTSSRGGADATAGKDIDDACVVDIFFGG